MAPAPRLGTSVAELWLGTLERVVGRAAHEIKGVMNGVGVNLEVVRMRSARADAPASAVASFAGTAAGQFELLTGMTEALLALARPVRAPIDLGAILAQYCALLVPAARAEGVALELPTRLPESVPLDVDGDVARMLIGEAFLAAIDGRRDAVCTVGLATRAEVRISTGSPPALELKAELVEPVRQAGVEVRSEGHWLIIAFPRIHATANDTA